MYNMRVSYLATIQQTNLFQNLQPATLEQLARNPLVRSVEEGGFFFMQDDPARFLYVLSAGRVKMSQLTPDGQQVIMRMIVPGQMFGGVAILAAGQAYPAAAQTLEDSQALAWDGDFLRQLAAHDPALSVNMLQLMHAYVEEMQARFREVVTERVEQRIANAVLRLAQQTGLRLQEGGIQLLISRQDLAETSGTTMYTASRILTEWERRGIVKTGRERLVITNPHELVSIAENLER